MKNMFRGLLAGIVLLFTLSANTASGQSDSQVEQLSASVYAAMSFFAYGELISDKEAKENAAAEVENACFKPEKFDHPTIKTPRCILFVNRKVRPIAYVLSFRGSVDSDDWLANILGGIGCYPGLYENAEKLVEKVVDIVSENNGTLVLTGHSLGGGLAEYVAGRYGLQAVTFNSSHLSVPFRPEKGAWVDSYYIPVAQFFHGCPYDLVHPLRLGGNFSYTQVHYLKKKPPSSFKQVLSS